jgi:dodecin
MAKAKAKASRSRDSVYRITELVGTSDVSWEDAATNAIRTASRTLRDIRVVEVTKLDIVVDDGKIGPFRARLNLSFKYEQ